jgi:hypothetical protein
MIRVAVSALALAAALAIGVAIVMPARAEPVAGATFAPLEPVGGGPR